MKRTSILILGVIFLVMMLFVQCSDNLTDVQEQMVLKKGFDKALAKGGPPDGKGPGDDSDAPDNPGKPDKEDPESQRGGDFGDLYILWRDADGAPICTTALGPMDELVAKEQPIGFVGVWDGAVGIPSIDPNFPGEYFFEEFLDYDFYWFGYYDIADEEVEWSEEYGALMGESQDATVITFTDGVMDQVSGIVPAGVEIGRKNLARAPQSVLNRALAEAIKTLTMDSDPLTIDFCGRLVGKALNADGEIVLKTIDSPRENMALYQYIMNNKGFDGEEFAGLAHDKLEALVSFERGQIRGIKSYLDIAASCFAAAADKTDNLYVDEIVYCNTFLGINGSDVDRHYNHYTNFLNYERQLRYLNRWIKIVTLIPGDPNAEPPTPNTYTEEIMSIAQAESEGKFNFTKKYEGLSYLAGFRSAADDAIQVLDYIHGDSNMEWLGFRLGNTGTFEK